MRSDGSDRRPQQKAEGAVGKCGGSGGFHFGNKKNDWLPGRRRATSGLGDLFLSFFASLSANTANSHHMSLLLAASRLLLLQKNSGLKVLVFLLPVDPRCFQGGSRVFPGCFQGGSRVDPGWIQGRSRVDPGCVQDGSRVDPEWIQGVFTVDHLLGANWSAGSVDETCVHVLQSSCRLSAMTF